MPDEVNRCMPEKKDYKKDGVQMHVLNDYLDKENADSENHYNK